VGSLEKLWTAFGWLRRTQRGRLVSRVLAGALLAFLAVRLWRLWSSTDLSLREVRPAIAVAAVAVSAIAVASYGCVWLVVLDRLGVAAHARQLTLFFKSQLGKYIPGSVWQYAGRLGLGRAEAIPAKVGLASIAIETAASLVAALIVGSLVLSLWVTVVVTALGSAAAAAAVRARGWMSPIAARVPVGDTPLVLRSVRVFPLAMPLYGVVWIVYGTAFWLTARALFVIPAADVPLYIGVFAVSWAVGFVAIFAPGGVGVREAMIVALLAGHLGEARAIVLAGASRLVLTLIDLVLGGIAVASMGRPGLRAQGLEARR
jgi:hypothetical protein